MGELALLQAWICVSACAACKYANCESAIKLNLKKCAVGKIKNTEGSAMRVGSVAVQLQYGLYVVGHLSKLAFQFMFIVVCLVDVV